MPDLLDPNNVNELLYGDYALKCKVCGATRTLHECVTSGLKIGDVIQVGGDDYWYGRCRRCSRSNVLEVTSVPDSGAVVEETPGFSRLPTV